MGIFVFMFTKRLLRLIIMNVSKQINLLAFLFGLRRLDVITKLRKWNEKIIKSKLRSSVTVRVTVWYIQCQTKFMPQMMKMFFPFELWEPKKNWNNYEKGEREGERNSPKSDDKIYIFCNENDKKIE